ncbi:MAG TPA: O-antigen translocase [Flavisolibacter sp.]|nr:O-antigen translocase [Flavisolibacter sp.]
MSDQESKKQILKSASILGSVQLINILIGIIRVKALAILLGPKGVGISGIYQTIVTLVSTATGFGINLSGVREVASADATGDRIEMGRKALVLHQWAWFTGLLGMLLTIIFSRQISRYAFGDDSYASGVVLLSIALVLVSVTGGLNAYLQGTRKIGELAKANIFSAILGLVAAVSIYYFWGSRGIVAALLATFTIGYFSTYFFYSKVKINSVKINLKESFQDGFGMVKLGLFLVASALSGNVMLFLVRAFIVKEGGLENVGYFIAAWTISSMYTSAIFSAMGTDFYPRLSGVADNNRAIIKLVNEQTEVALLLTTPIIIFMISFIGVVVNIFYSHEFAVTSTILNWQLVGDFFKVLGWPLGYILLAKARGKLFLLVELVWNFSYLVFVFWGWPFLGIESSGIAFVLAFVLNVSLAFLLVRKQIHFKWSRNVLVYITFFLPLVL